MADEAQDSETPKSDVKEAGHDIESQIQKAMYSRVSHFKEQADNLTFEKVRRLLEKDLGLETYALDVHRRYIKQCLVKCLDGADDDTASKNSEEIELSREEAVELLEGPQSKKDVKESCSEDEGKMEDSPVMGLLTGRKKEKIETEEIKRNDNKEIPSENTIKKAIRKRVSYIKANAENISMAAVRRLLEDDLKLDKFILDPFKKFISQQVEEILNSSEVSKPDVKKKSGSKASKKVSSEDSSDSVVSESGEEDDNEVKPRKKNVPKGKLQNSDGPKKRKRPSEEMHSGKKGRKPSRRVSEDNSDEEKGGNVSEDSQSQLSTEKPIKKKEVPASAYGKRVEHLKSVIKSCGMSVPPSVYKKVKLVPENQRETQLIKELEEILSREGLSTNPTEKEIKEVKKRKERAKELEGIDTSNIVLSSRRRSTTSFVAPPKPPKPVESDGNDSEDTEEEEDEEDDDDDDEDNNDDGEEDAEDDGDDSQSEELNEDDDKDGD